MNISSELINFVMIGFQALGGESHEEVPTGSSSMKRDFVIWIHCSDNILGECLCRCHYKNLHSVDKFIISWCVLHRKFYLCPPHITILEMLIPGDSHIRFHFSILSLQIQSSRSLPNHMLLLRLCLAMKFLAACSFRQTLSCCPS